MSDLPLRCSWCGSDPLYIKYHDSEWGTPLHDDTKLFEFLILEGFQAGLSWLTILKKRKAFHEAFCDFNASKIAQFNQKNIDALLVNRNIVRNRLKIGAAVENARCFIKIVHDFGTFDRYIWQFVGGHPKINAWESEDMVPSTTPEAEFMSKDLRKRGFKFVGPTICYAFMQATGMVNDHITSCYRYSELQTVK